MHLDTGRQADIYTVRDAGRLPRRCTRCEQLTKTYSDHDTIYYGTCSNYFSSWCVMFEEAEIKSVVGRYAQWLIVVYRLHRLSDRECHDWSESISSCYYVRSSLRNSCALCEEGIFSPLSDRSPHQRHSKTIIRVY